MPLAPGDAFAGYTIVRLLGSGGMGEVYLAQHPRLPRQDALKILPESMTADSEFRERFNREADLAARLFHPHIVGVHDRGEFDGRLWISMDYVEGTDAAQLMRERYPAGMPADEVVEIVTAVASALDYAQQRGLLHRDVKPANILLSQPNDEGERRVFLADFGIARELADPNGITATNLTVGTVAYAAPEQLMGSDIDGRADQYAVAATAFHLLSGAPPYQHSNPVAVISQHLNAAPPALSDRCPDLAFFDDVLSKALAKDPNDRFDRCIQFAKALRERLAGRSISEHTTQASITADSPTTTRSTDTAAPRRLPLRRISVAIAAILAVLVIAAISWTGLHNSPKEKPAAAPHLAGPPSNNPASAAVNQQPTTPPVAVPTQPPQTHMAPYNCPPACDRIPDSAWIDPTAIPLYSTYSWPPLSGLAVTPSTPRFRFEEFCGTAPTQQDPRDNAVAAKATYTNPPDQWQLQAQVMHWRGDPWIGGQYASTTMDSAAAALRACQLSTPQVSVSVTTNKEEGQQNPSQPGERLAAVISVGGAKPFIVHQYLVSDLRNSTIVEVAMWAQSPPTVGWPETNDDQLFDAMIAPLCTAYVHSC